MTALNDNDKTAIRTELMIAVKKDTMGVCPECHPEKDGEEHPVLVLIFTGGDIMVLDYESEELRNGDYETLCEI